jgi:hypothetical protein
MWWLVAGAMKNRPEIAQPHENGRKSDNFARK